MDKENMNKATATRKANALLKRMKGSNWKKDVDDICGSYIYYVYNAGLQIYPCEINGKTKYCALLSHQPDQLGGEWYWDLEQYYEDPNDAAEHQLKVAEQFIYVCKKKIKALRENLKGG